MFVSTYTLYGSILDENGILWFVVYHTCIMKYPLAVE